MSYAGGGWARLDTRYTGSSGNWFYFTSDNNAYSILAIGNTRDGIAGLPVIGGAATPAPAVFRTLEASPSLAAPGSHVIAREDTTAPAVQQPMAEPPAPAADSAMAGSSGFPFVSALLIITGCAVLIGGWYARRWWIRRQNPTLFREYD